MTFYELLYKYPIEELWYILSKRHDLSGKPIKSEQMFLLYKAARDELLTLHSPDNPAEDILVCNFRIETDEPGAPDVWIHCNMLSPVDGENGEMKTYAIDYVSWAELIDCRIANESIAKFGELICASEILWEMTFHGFSVDRVNCEAKKLDKLAADIESGLEKTYPWNPKDFMPTKDSNEREEAYIKGWLANAPNAVKTIVHGFFESDDDEESANHTLQRLEHVLAKSTVDTSDDSPFVPLLRAMTANLDVDKAHLLLRTMFNKPEQPSEAGSLDVYDDPPLENLPQAEFYIQGSFDFSTKLGGYQLLMVYGEHKKLIEAQNLEGTSDVSMILEAVAVGLSNLKKPCEITVFSNTLFGINDIYRKGRLRHAVRPKAANYERKERIRQILRDNRHVMDNLVESNMRKIINDFLPE